MQCQSHAIERQGQLAEARALVPSRRVAENSSAQDVKFQERLLRPVEDSRGDSDGGGAAGSRFPAGGRFLVRSLYYIYTV